MPLADPSLELSLSGPVIHVANGRQTPMHRLQDAVPELLKCHDLNGWPWLPYPTASHSVLSRSLTGPPLALPPAAGLLDTGLQVFT